MQTGQPRLVIDYGTVATAAVIVWPDGRWVPLRFDTSVMLPSAVVVGDGEGLVTGQQAWQRAVSEPDGFVVAPLTMGTGTIAVGGVDVEVADLVAATLRRVAVEAARVAGAPVGEVRMVVPAGWGPRRRTWLRTAAYRAGLGQPRLVSAPVAAADLVLSLQVPIPVGALLLMVDLGSGCEVSVLRRDTDGFEVLSTLVDPQAGGLAIDEALAAEVTRETAVGDGVTSPGVTSYATTGAGQPRARWALVNSLRRGKEAVSRQAAVTVALPSPAPARVLTTADVQAVAEPVLQRAADLAANAVTAAEITTGQLFGVYCIGAAAATPSVAPIFGARLGVLPAVLPDPGIVAVVGAAGTTRLEQAPGPAPARTAGPAPGVRRAVALLVPGLASLVLVAQFLSTMAYESVDRGSVEGIVNWGELAVASVMAVLTCLAAGTMLGTLLSRLEQSRPGRVPQPVSVQGQVGNGVVAAAAIGLAVAGLYAVVTALYTGREIGAVLPWALYPAGGVAVLATAVTLLTLHRQHTRSDWDGYLTFPPSAVVLVAVGMLLVQHTLTTFRWSDLAVYLDVGTRVGGLLIGVGTAFVLVKVWMLRLVVAVPLGLFMASIVNARSTGVLAVMFTVAVLWWWAYRLLAVLRPQPVPDHAA